MSNPRKAPDTAGRDADSPLEMGGKGYKEIALRTWKESTKDNIGLVAAGVAFYAFLALVPLLGATVLSYGLIAKPSAVVSDMKSMMGVMPTDVAKLIGDQLMNVVKTSSGKKGFGILIALVIALFGARNAAGSIIIALNIAYEEEEKRGFLKVTLLALTITLGAVVLALLAMGAITLLKYLRHFLPGTSGIGLIISNIVTYALIGLGGAAAAATLYRYAPSRAKAKWTWLTPGSAFAAIAWLLITILFGIYVTRFAHYNATYGSLGAVVALLTWIYLSAYVFLFGAELNSEFEHQTAKDTTAGSPDPLGERRAWSADHVANGPDDEGKEAETGGKESLSDEKPAGSGPPPTPAPANPEREHAYLASRATARVGKWSGLPKLGMVSSILSTAGLAMLRKRGRGGAGAAMLATAAGLALLRRKDD